MMEVAAKMIARVGGLESMFYDSEQLSAAIDRSIHQRMKELYHDGCRRFRVVRLPRTGDDYKHAVFGWSK